MSTRTNLRPQLVITAGDMSGSLTSAPTILQSLTGISYQLSWSGTSPVGTASVQVSNDYSLNPNGTVNNAGTWTTLVLSQSGVFGTTIAISGNTGNAGIGLSDLEFYAIRLIYTRTSGVGSLNVMVAGKVS